MSVALRPAREDERAMLDDICFRAKAHWGYDTIFMENVRDHIRVSPEAIALGRVWVALGPGGAPGGVVQVDRLDARHADLTLLFVAPEYMRAGLGRALFDKACDLARDLDSAELLIDSDPQAAGFYAAMGARHVGDTATGYQGRLLPKFSMALKPGRR